MTRDPAAQAVHERLESAVASMPRFDVEAGWAALAAELEPAMAPVIPLRRRRSHRALVLGVAAALLVAGSAFAARHGATPALSILPPTAGPSSGLVIGPHVHAAFSGAPPTSGGGSDPSGGSDHDPHGSRPAGGGTTDGPSSSGGGGGSPAPDGGPNQDSPDDTDHGSGNDGQHDDNGGGNDTTGQDSNAHGSNGNAGGNAGHGSGGADGSNQHAAHDRGADHAAGH